MLINSRTKSYRVKPYLILLGLTFTLLVACNKQPTLYLIGDSTMADKEKLYLPERGWGQLFPYLFNDNIFIENHAKNGRSTRSFIYEGRWDSVCNKLHANDYVIIQFGHNDDVESKLTRYTTLEEYEYNLRKYVFETRQKGAIPILATPVVRRRFDEHGQFYGTHGEYPNVVRDLATELKVPLLDLHMATMEYVKELGEEKSKDLYLHYQPGEHDSLPEGKIDDTHFCEFGALEVAKLAAQQLKNNVQEFEVYLKD